MGRTHRRASPSSSHPTASRPGVAGLTPPHSPPSAPSSATISRPTAVSPPPSPPPWSRCAAAAYDRRCRPGRARKVRAGDGCGRSRRCSRCARRTSSWLLRHRHDLCHHEVTPLMLSRRPGDDADDPCSG
jgi:hypothetical protein